MKESGPPGLLSLMSGKRLMRNEVMRMIKELQMSIFIYVMTMPNSRPQSGAAGPPKRAGNSLNEIICQFLGLHHDAGTPSSFKN